LSLYKKSPPELYLKQNPLLSTHIDTEIDILNILREKIIDAGVSPCVVEILYATRCCGIKKYLKGKKKINPGLKTFLTEFSRLVQSGLAYDKWAFIALEQCDITLEAYLTHRIGTPISTEMFRGFMFQIIYTLHAIKKLYPSFKHNDLHTENVMLSVDKSFKWSSKQRFFLQFTIEVNGKPVSYYVPYFGVIIKIIDFGFATISELGIVSNVVEDLSVMFYRQNEDIITLLHWIGTAAVKYPTYDDDIGIILNKLDPTESYKDISQQSSVSINDMITNELFDDYLEKPSGQFSILKKYTYVGI